MDKAVLKDRFGNVVAEIPLSAAPFTFELETTHGLKPYKLNFIYKRDPKTGERDYSKPHGAILN